MSITVPTVVMRGGTSKGLYFRQSDLPQDAEVRDRLLLALMGSPDPRQIDGMGGAHPLTSKVAVISASPDTDADVDYLFLQVAVDRMLVTAGQNCGNILAGVGPFAIEHGFVSPASSVTTVRVRMLNSGGIASVQVQTPGGQVEYSGDAAIDGVPGTAAPIMIDFADVAGTSCGALLPTGHLRDIFDGVSVTCVDNGMPVVILRAPDLAQTGYESPEALESNQTLKDRIESIRLQAGAAMQLGDVTNKTVPKMTLAAAPEAGGAVATRTFIPHRVHQSIGVLGAASVAAACRLPGSVLDGLAHTPADGALDVEHPSGKLTVDIELSETDTGYAVTRSALLRTARKLMEGVVFAPEEHSYVDH